MIDRRIVFQLARALLPRVLLLGAMCCAALAGAQQQQEDSQEKIVEDQIRLTDQYRLLEEKLFSLYQYEQEQNPARSELLQRAFQQSKEQLTLSHLNAAVRYLQQARLRDAEQNQELTLQHLKQLLALLQSEDRNKRVREEIDRYQQYLEEVNRILRVQQGIRAQTENGMQSERLKNSQQKNAERTEKLADEIKDNEESKPSESEADSAEDASRTEPTDPQGKQPDDRDEPSDTKPHPDSDQKQDSGSPPNAQSADAPPADDQSAPGGTPASGQSQQPNPVRQRLKNAEQKMKQAQEKLDKAKQDESVEDMREAERELAEAKRELEEILRQLREEEIQRTLASLETRFRRMLEIQVKIYDDTVRLGEVEMNSRNAEFEIQAGKLAVDERTLVTEASQVLLLLQDDGTSIAIAETVRQMQMDMQQTAQRLSAAKVDKITQSIEEDIIENLNNLVEAFERAQEDLENQSKAPPPGGAQLPGEQPLIDQIAELKLIRGLQQQILKRHQRYAELLDDPDDAVGQTSDPGLMDALLRLSERQRNLQQMTRDIVVGKNR